MSTRKSAPSRGSRKGEEASPTLARGPHLDVPRPPEAEKGAATTATARSGVIAARLGSAPSPAGLMALGPFCASAKISPRAFQVWLRSEGLEPGERRSRGSWAALAVMFNEREV